MRIGPALHRQRHYKLGTPEFTMPCCVANLLLLRRLDSAVWREGLVLYPLRTHLTCWGKRRCVNKKSRFFSSPLSPLYLCFHSGNVQRAIPPRLDRVLPFRQRHAHQEQERLGRAQRRQDREPERVDVARRFELRPGAEPRITLPPAERESKLTPITDKALQD